MDREDGRYYSPLRTLRDQIKILILEVRIAHLVPFQLFVRSACLSFLRFLSLRDEEKHLFDRKKMRRILPVTFSTYWQLIVVEIELRRRR
mmetsp:Transcript_16473/g.33623  ORF Transcript_16473/g.33623 Transcript_16473/m.33623 type:complete len:90 (+) Transcript_16473:496-765(+)